MTEVLKETEFKSIESNPCIMALTVKQLTIFKLEHVTFLVMLRHLATNIRIIMQGVYNTANVRLHNFPGFP